MFWEWTVQQVSKTLCDMRRFIVIGSVVLCINACFFSCVQNISFNPFTGWRALEGRERGQCGLIQIQLNFVSVPAAWVPISLQIQSPPCITPSSTVLYLKADIRCYWIACCSSDSADDSGWYGRSTLIIYCCGIFMVISRSLLLLALLQRIHISFPFQYLTCHFNAPPLRLRTYVFFHV